MGKEELLGELTSRAGPLISANAVNYSSVLQAIKQQDMQLIVYLNVIRTLNKLTR
jgi:hypothetical protein